MPAEIITYTSAKVHTIKKGKAPKIADREVPKHDVKAEAFLDEKNNLRLSVGIPDIEGDAPPMDICCVIDISQSMINSAACQTDGKTEYEDLGYSLLDLVKHAVKTVLKVLRPDDRASLILFNDQVFAAYDFTQMTEKNRAAMISTVEQIKPVGATNICDAIKAGMDLISQRTEVKNNAAIIFFTDGQPTVGLRGGGLVDSLKQHKKETEFNYPVHTMCFG